ncbi:hypothetical protein ACFLYN_00290, partial [Chloroflexota bacterium]
MNKIATDSTVAVYALDGANEYVMWKLLHQDWASDFVSSGQVGTLNITNCGTEIIAYVTMRAIPGQGGLVLSSEDAVILPEKEVDPTSAEKNEIKLYTYIIRMEQLSSNTTIKLDAVYDLLPAGVQSIVSGECKLRIDGGEWLDFPDPNIDNLGSDSFIFWPADYDKDTGSDNFSSLSDVYDHDIENFTTRQVKEIKFQAWARLGSGVWCNRAILKPWNTVSEAGAPIDVDDPVNPGECEAENSV